MFFIQAISYAKYAKGQIRFVFYEITVASRHTFQYAKYVKVPKGTPQFPPSALKMVTGGLVQSGVHVSLDAQPGTTSPPDPRVQRFGSA